MLHHQQKDHRGWLRQLLGISSKYEKHGESGQLGLAQKEKPLALSEKKRIHSPSTQHRYREDELPGKVRKTVVLTESTKHDAKKQVETEGEGGGEEVEVIEITRVKKEFLLEDRPGVVRKQVLVSRGPIIEEGVVTEEEEEDGRGVLKLPARSRRVSSEPRTVRHYTEELREPDIERRKYVTREVIEEPLQRPRKLSARASEAPRKYYVEYEEEEPERREIREEPLQRREIREEPLQRREIREEPLQRPRKLSARASEAPRKYYVEYEEEEPERREVREEPLQRREVREEPLQRHRKLSARAPEAPVRKYYVEYEEEEPEVAPTTAERVYVSEPRVTRYREPPQTRREVPEYYVGEQGRRVEEPIVRKTTPQEEPEYYRKPLKRTHITPPTVRPPSPKPTVQARISSDVEEAVNGEHVIRIEERPGPSLEEERGELRRAEVGTRYSQEAELPLPSIVKPSSAVPTTAERSVRERESPSRIIRTEEREVTPTRRREYREPPEFFESEEARQQEEAGRRARPIPKAKLGHRRRRLIEDEEREQSASPVLMRKEPATKYPKEYEEEREAPTESPDRYSEEFPPLETSEPSEREKGHEGREGSTVTYTGSALAGYRQESVEEGEEARGTR